ncbi:MAG: site-specific integrase [Arenimonas sp.]
MLAVQDILAEAASANTTRSYTSALRYWAAWYMARFGDVIGFPVAEAVVIQFIVDHIARKTKNGLTTELPAEIDSLLVQACVKSKLGAMKLSTVTHRVAVLSSLHTLKKLANPCEEPSVRHLLSRARRASVKRGERPNKKTAITKLELEALLATCDDSLEGKRDRALLYFGFASGGRRRSEIAAADWQDLVKVDANTFIYSLMRSKTEQSGPVAGSVPEKPILGAAAVALADWLDTAPITSGALFRRLWKTRVGPPLSSAAVAEIVQRRSQLAGLTGDFAGHSLRSGFVTEAGRQGASLADVMAMTGHRSVNMVLTYFQSGAAVSNPAANLLVEKLVK